MNLQLIVLVGLLGGAGAVVRYLLRRLQGKFPTGILIANTIASFIGGLAASALVGDPTLSLILISGFAGGLSTFSTFAAQTSSLFSDKHGRLAWANTALNFALPLAAAALGTNLGLALLK